MPIQTAIPQDTETAFISLLPRISRKDSQSPRGYCPYNFDACDKTCINWRRNRCRKSGIIPGNNQSGISAGGSHS